MPPVPGQAGVAGVEMPKRPRGAGTVGGCMCVCEWGGGRASGGGRGLALAPPLPLGGPAARSRSDIFRESGEIIAGFRALPLRRFATVMGAGERGDLASP